MRRDPSCPHPPPCRPHPCGLGRFWDVLTEGTAQGLACERQSARAPARQPRRTMEGRGRAPASPSWVGALLTPPRDTLLTGSSPPPHDGLALDRLADERYLCAPPQLPPIAAPLLVFRKGALQGDDRRGRPMGWPWLKRRGDAARGGSAVGLLQVAGVEKSTRLYAGMAHSEAVAPVLDNVGCSPYVDPPYADVLIIHARLPQARWKRSPFRTNQD